MKKIALALLIFCGNSYASDWAVVDWNNAASVSVDKNSITKQGLYRKAWLLWNYSSEQQTYDYPIAKWKSLKALNYFNCEQKTTSSFKRSLYSENAGGGSVVRNYDFTFKESELSEVVPDSMGESHLIYVCAYPIDSKKK